MDHILVSAVGGHGDEDGGEEGGEDSVFGFEDAFEVAEEAEGGAFFGVGFDAGVPERERGEGGGLGEGFDGEGGLFLGIL